MVINFCYRKDSDKFREIYHYLAELININDLDVQIIVLDEKLYEDKPF